MLYLLLLLTITFSNNILHAAALDAEESIYEKLGKITVPTLEDREEEWPDSEQFIEFVNRCMEFQLNPSPAKKRRLMSGRILPQFALPGNFAFIDQTTWQDLQLFAGNQQSPHAVGNILNRAATEAGTLYFLKMLAEPLVEINALKNRQDAIQICRALLPACKPHLAALAKAENITLSFCVNDPLFGSLRNFCSFSRLPIFLQEKLNQSEFALQIRNCLEHQKRWLTFASGPTSAAVLAASGIAALTLPQNRIPSFEGLLGSAHPVLPFATLATNQLPSVTARLCQAAIAFTGAAFSLTNTPADFAWARAHWHLISCLRTKLMHVAQFCHAATQLTKCIAQQPQLLTKIPELQALVTLLQTTEMSTFFKALEHPVFHHAKTNIFLYQGKIITAYQAVHANKTLLKKLLAAVGCLDAHFSIAQLYEESLTTRTPYCFVEYRQQATPYLHLENFYHPLLDPTTAVMNSVQLGTSEGGSHMIITGPNAGGKSTIVKGIMTTVILAQALTIAPCTQAVVTPFSSIGTYLNIADNITTGHSLFQAQASRAQELVHRVEALNKHQFVLLAFDEMFNGTEHHEAEAASTMIASYLESYSNTMAIFATHFAGMTKLGETNKTIKNYCVPVDPTTLHGPFILQRGCSTQHIAFELLKKQGLSSRVFNQKS